MMLLAFIFEQPSYYCKHLIFVRLMADGVSGKYESLEGPLLKKENIFLSRYYEKTNS